MAIGGSKKAIHVGFAECACRIESGICRAADYRPTKRNRATADQHDRKLWEQRKVLSDSDLTQSHWDLFTAPTRWASKMRPQLGNKRQMLANRTKTSGGKNAILLDLRASVCMFGVRNRRQSTSIFTLYWSTATCAKEFDRWMLAPPSLLSVCPDANSSQAHFHGGWGSVPAADAGFQLQWWLLGSSSSVDAGFVRLRLVVFRRMLGSYVLFFRLVIFRR